MFSPAFVVIYIIAFAIGYNFFDFSGSQPQPSGYYFLAGIMIMIAAMATFALGAFFIRVVGDLYERYHIWEYSTTQYRLSKVSWSVDSVEKSEYIVEYRVKFPLSWGTWRKYWSSTTSTVEEGTKLLEHAKSLNKHSIDRLRELIASRSKTVVIGQ